MSPQITVYLDEYLSEFDDTDLVDEIRDRGYKVYASPEKLKALEAKTSRRHGIEPDTTISIDDELEEIKTAIIERRQGDAIALIDRLLNPRFRDPEQCRGLYEAAMKVGAN